MPAEVSLHVVSDGRTSLAGASAAGGAASLLLSTEKGQFLFNVPDPVQRYFTEKKQWKYGKLRGILFTEVTSATAAGFTDLAMAMADLDMNKSPLVDAAVVPAAVSGPAAEEREQPRGKPAFDDPCLLVAGPSPLYAYLLTLNLIFYRPTYHIRLEELQPRSAARARLQCSTGKDQPHAAHGNDCMDTLLLSEGVSVRPILVQLPRDDDPSYLASPEYLSPAYNIGYKLTTCDKVPAKDVVCYAIHTPEIRGQFDVKAALALGVPKGPLFGRLVNGETVTTPDGKEVTPDMCVGPAQPGPVALVVRCPGKEWVSALVDNGCLRHYRDSQGASGAAQVTTVVHMTPLDVAMSKPYAEFFAGFYRPPAAAGKGKKKAAAKKKGKADAPLATHVFLDATFGGSSSAVRSLPLLTSVEYQVRLNQLVPEVAAAPMELQAYDVRGALEETARVREILLPSYAPAPAASIQLGSFEEVYTLQPLSKAGLCADEVDSSALRAAAFLEPGFAPAQSTSSPPERPWKPATDDVTPSVMFLGTAASSPTKYRGVSSILLEVPEFGNMLLDCGGGTYEQLHRLLGPAGAAAAIRQLKCVWITHKHADHCLGILPLLVQASRLDPVQGGAGSFSSAPGSQICGTCGHGHDYASSKAVDSLVHSLVSSNDVGLPQFTEPSPELQAPPDGAGARPLLVVGPMWISMWLKQHSHWVEDLHYRFVHAQDLTAGAAHPLQSFFLQELGLDFVQAVLMEHSYPTFGVVLRHVCGWKLVYSADSRPSQVLASIGKGATLLIHEATFDAPFQAKALADRHSTVEEAIAVGTWMEAEFVVLTHFSNRFESGKFPNIWSPAFLDLRGMQGRLLVAADLLRLPLDSAQLQLLATQVLPRLQALASE